MTNAPHLLPKSRAGYKYGSVELLDAMAFDGLTDAFDHIPMGESTEHHNTKLGPDPRGAGRVLRPLAPARRASPRRTASSTRRSPRSRSRSARATRSSSATTRASAPTPRPSRWPSCARPSPRTAPSPPGSASQISDGAAAVVVMSKAKAEELGLSWLAEIGAHGNVAGPDNSLQSQPANAIKHALRQGGPVGRRPRPDRDQRGVRGRRPAVDEGPRRGRGDRQRQRRRHRARPPDRHVRRAAGASASRSSSSAAAAAPVRRRCAAAAVRATR